MLSTILDRAKEPSTYAGLASIAAAFGVSTDLYNAASIAAASVFGLVAVILKEKAA